MFLDPSPPSKPSAAMGSKAGPPHWMAGTGSSSCSSPAVWPEAKEDKKKAAARARNKPKRTTFACLECSKTFPSQQAMAGHCSAHTRAGARRVPPARHTTHLPAAAPVAVAAAPPITQQLPPEHYRHNLNAVQYWCPPVRVQVAPSTIPIPQPRGIRYVPYARPVVSNQMMTRLPYLDLHGRRSGRRLATADPATNPAFRPAAWPMPPVPASGRLGWRAFVPFFTAPPPLCVNGAPPSDAVSSTDRPGGTRAADLTLRLSFGRRDHAQKKTLPLLQSLVMSDGRGGADRKCKLAITDGGGDQGSNKGDDQMDGLDLDLRLHL